ncbi:uncharacterized protein LOC132175979 [Corylus avellana]|uniref:uncharacterized protein LOC132175979 n=1 Tax=Corylus avellana TaxID=13451 RepID=UPI00286BFD79|nr:uncharacterized protein LOC132175979 [Corylus avellana]
MGYSKTFLLFGLVFAVVLLISHVSARELLAEAAQTQETEAVEEVNYGDHSHGHGHGHHGHGHDHRHHLHHHGHHHGHHGHGAAGETETEN